MEPTRGGHINPDRPLRGPAQAGDVANQSDRRDGDVPAGADGRPYLLGAAGAVTLFAAVAGYVVAANNAVDAVTVFGLVRLPGTPAAMALYGAVLSLVVVGVLFGLVSIASRYDEGAP